MSRSRYSDSEEEDAYWSGTLEAQRQTEDRVPDYPGYNPTMGQWSGQSINTHTNASIPFDPWSQNNQNNYPLNGQQNHGNYSYPVIYGDHSQQNQVWASGDPAFHGSYTTDNQPPSRWLPGLQSSAMPFQTMPSASQSTSGPALTAPSLSNRQALPPDNSREITPSASLNDSFFSSHGDDLDWPYNTRAPEMGTSNKCDPNMNIYDYTTTEPRSTLSSQSETSSSDLLVTVPGLHRRSGQSRDENHLQSPVVSQMYKQ